MNSRALANLQASVKSRTSLALLALGLVFAAASGIWRVGLELQERSERQAGELKLLPLLYGPALALSVAERRDEQTQELLAAMAERHGATHVELHTVDGRRMAVGDDDAHQAAARSEFTLSDPQQNRALLGSVHVALPAVTLSEALRQDRQLQLQLLQNLALALVLGLAAAWLFDRMLLRHLRRITSEMQRFDASQPPSQLDWPAPAPPHAPLELRQMNAALAHVQQSVDSQLQREQSRAEALQLEVERQSTALRHVERELQAKQRELAALSRVDALTGLANRSEFDEALRREFKRAQRQHGKLALAVMDLDAFKPYNRQHGHGAGDAALQIVARLLGERFKRDTDLVARFGGEEFVVLLPGLDQAGAQGLLEQLRDDLRALGLANAEAPGGVLTLSVGLAAYGAQQPYLSSQALLQAADEALAVAKHAGRDRLSLAA